MAFKVDNKKFEELTAKLADKIPNSFVDPNSNVVSIKKKLMLDSPGLNYYFGGRGFAYTRIHQIYGPEHAGKTSLFIAIAANLQREIPKIIPGKNIVLYVDFERTFDPLYAQKLGLDTSPEKFKLIHADTGEDAFYLVEQLIPTGKVCCVVLDSDAAVITRSEFEEEEVGKATYGGSAKLLSSIVRKMNVLCANYDTAYLVISQERVDPTAHSSYGPVKKSTGGDVVKFFSTTRSRIKKMEQLEDKAGNGIGIKVKLTNIKNKSGEGAIPWRTLELNLYFENGFDVNSEYVDMMVNLASDLPSIQHPSKVMFNSTKYGFSCRGKEAFKEWLTNPTNKKAFEELKQEVNIVMKQHTTLDDSNIQIDGDKEDGIDEIPEIKEEDLEG
jgi:protein RecA